MLIVDRIENETAVCETDSQKMVRISLSKCIGPVREGDVLTEVRKGVYQTDVGETKRLREEAVKLSKKLFE